MPAATNTQDAASSLRRLGERYDAALARRVVGLAEIAGLPDEGADIDDATILLFDHHRHDGGDTKIASVEIGFEHDEPIVVQHFAQRLVARNARVVDQNVKPPPGLGDRRDHRDPGRALAYVALE